MSAESQVVIYTDAESTGHIGLVLVYKGRCWYARADIPNAIKRKLKRRRTNIRAYEVIAAVLGIFTLDQILPEHVCIRHYVDNLSAKECIITGHSEQDDLNDIIGVLWHTAAHRSVGYWNDWVQSKANLADAPSRNDTSLMRQLQATEIVVDFNRYTAAAEKWRSDPTEACLVRLG